MKRISYLSLAIVALLTVFVLAACAPTPASPTPTAAPTETETPPPATATPSPTGTPEATPSPTASPTASPSPTAQPTPGGDGTAPAVQALLDYYTAINEQRFQDAYDFWADDGAASGQTFEQFAAGFENTVQTTILIDDVLEENIEGGQVVVILLRLLSVVNEADNTQSVQRFSGDIVLESVSNDWRITDGNLSTPPTGDNQPPADVAGPDTVIRSYYDAINARRYAKAYTYWNNLGQSSGQTFAAFRSGFGETANVVVDLGEVRQEGAAGSVFATVPVTITATQTDGSTQRFEGAYTVRRANVPPFDQFGWRIESADITETP